MIRNLALCFLSCLPAMMACAAAPEPAVFPGKDWQQVPPREVGLDDAKVNLAMDQLKSICGKLGNSRAVVVYKGRIVWAGTDVQTPTPVWSSTKSFMSTCLGLLWDDGKCTPSTRLAEVCPEYTALYPTVTLEHLATFTSGYDADPKNAFAATKPMYAPGEKMHYSIQADVLALALTRIAGEPLKDLFMRRVGNPIGIDETQFQWRDFGKHDGLLINGGSGFPESGIHTNAYQMARFGWLYACGGKWNGKQLISTRYIQYATAPRVDSKLPPYEANGWYTVLPGCYGLNWWVNGIEHTGVRKWPSAPASTFAAQGNNNNICIVLPEWEMVLVRLGGDQVIDVDHYDQVLATLHSAMPAK